MSEIKVTAIYALTLRPATPRLTSFASDYSNSFSLRVCGVRAASCAYISIEPGFRKDARDNPHYPWCACNRQLMKEPKVNGIVRQPVDLEPFSQDRQPSTDTTSDVFGPTHGLRFHLVGSRPKRGWRMTGPHNFRRTYDKAR